MIIGIIDTGITPKHPSFNDDNIPPPPKKWKGNPSLRINNKILSIKTYHGYEDISVDIDGHGTHVASIAAGNFVPGANVSNQLQGTASGIAPHASLAIYQITTDNEKDEKPLFREAIMDAVDDGVDVINVSFSYESSSDFGLEGNSIELGAFYATTMGVLVCCCAGNDGPFRSSVLNSAPWILTVGAANIDRLVKATIKLGNNELVYGESINQPICFPQCSYKVVYANYERMEGKDYEGKIAFYHPELFDSDKDAENKYEMIKSHVVAIIEANREKSGYTMEQLYRDIPTARVSFSDGVRIMDYLDSAKKPTASLRFKGTTYGDDNIAPDVASFSGRGPSRIYKGIIKPDVIAPGVEILGANKSGGEGTFGVDSGTSTACPHVAGLVALLKASHPGWSPAMIKSAIMTTAYWLKRNGEPIQDQRRRKAGLYSMGSGHVDAMKANDPGIVFDVAIDEYVSYLVGLRLFSKQELMEMLGRREIPNGKGMEGAELNLPSFCLQLRPGETKSYKRTGQNVGEAESTYVVKVNCPEKVKVVVAPEEIIFVNVNEKITFEVSFELEHDRDHWKRTPIVEGWVALVSSKHTVRMPFLIEVISGKKIKQWK